MTAPSRLAAAMIALALGGLAAPARAYVRSKDPDTGACLLWATRAVPWVLNEQGAHADATFEEVRAAARRSFAAWADVGCSDLGFEELAPTARVDAGFSPGASDNLNLLVWRDTRCADEAPASDACHATPGACGDKYNCWEHSSGIIALTTTNYNKNTGVIVDADIEFNQAPDAGGHRYRFTATTAGRPPLPVCATDTATGCVATDIENTVTHENGHFIGLDHSPVPTSTMYFTAEPGETSKRELAQDDEEGLCAIYPAGLPPVTCTPGQRILLEPTGEGDDGCAHAGAAWVALLPAALARRRRPRR